MINNPLKSKLAAGQVVMGSFVTIPSAALAEIMGRAGFDFVVIDMEHGPIELETAEHMVRAAELAGVTPIIRVSHNTPHLTLRALDTGAMGVHVPDVSNPAAARAAVASVKYGPQGRRGLAGVRAARYGLQESLADYATTANQQTMIIAHIEDVHAIDNLDALLAVEGIDVYYLGPVDLSNSLGIPGQTQDSRVTDLVEAAIRWIDAADSRAARHYVELGARYIATHAIRFMVNGSRQFMQEVRP